MKPNNNKKLALIGAALGWGAQRSQTEGGPEFIHAQDFLRDLHNLHWQKTIYPSKTAKQSGPSSNLSYAERVTLISQTTTELAKQTAQAIQSDYFPLILGGDHSMAIGTWSGVTGALKAKQQFGLIWFDAHMDSHTPETTPSMAIHGMPLAILLGYGEPELVNLYEAGPKIDPKHVVLMGVRSYEAGEAELLAKLGVKIFYADEIKKRGFDVICQEALAIVNQGTQGFGVSIDLDGFDPHYAPGVGSPEKEGLTPQEVLPVLPSLFNHPQCKAIEIAEFNPERDQDNKTIKLIENIIQCARK